MYDLNSICFLCLNGNTTLKAVLHNDTATQVKYVLPEVIISNPVRICPMCCASVHTFYTFKKTCLDNYSRLMNTANTIQATGDTQGQKSSELQIKSYNSEPLVKQELDLDIEDNIEEENKDLLLLREKEVEHPIIEDIEIIEELTAAKEITEPGCYQQLEFVKCENVSDSEQNDASTVTSEDNNPFDKEDNGTFASNSDKVINFTISSPSHEVRKNGSNGTTTILPEKSKPKYQKEYQNFCEWCNGQNVINITENIVLEYFKIMNETKKASTLWANYSMLRTCISIYKDVDISKYSKVTAFLKRISQNYKPKKSKILDSEDILKFINDANNETFLAMKVILIMGSCGACRRNELTNMNINDVTIKSDMIKVNVPRSKTNISRMFIITEPSWIELIKKYVQMRPAHTKHSRFFLTYRKGRCTTSPIGINKIGVVPKDIANFLKLPNPELYTGHCFRRSSSYLANQGGDILTIRKHGEWKSSSVTEECIDSSLRKMLK